MKQAPLSRANIILIGMPGAGKSTVGVILAKQLSYSFIDTDISIQEHTHCTLQHTIDTHGYQALRDIEEQVLCNLNLKNHVIATGGSAVYSAQAMEHLAQKSITIFLHVPLATLIQRVHNYTTRGLAKQPQQNFNDLFIERHNLYTRYADITIHAGSIDQEETCTRIIQNLPTNMFKEAP